MDIVFEKGSSEEPKGHALIYFRSSADPSELWGSYLVILPIAVDVSKYVPPFLMNQVSPMDLSAFAFPPAPERIEGQSFLEQLAEKRSDDVLFCGTIDPADVAAGMMSVNEVVQRYSQMCSALMPAQAPAAGEPSAEEDLGLSVNEVMYGLMADNDKLSELTKLVGRLRYAAESGEEALAREAEVDINLLASHLPENHQVTRLIEVAKAGGNRGVRLADLYLQRCFHLTHEAYVKLGQVEDEIRTLESDGSPSA